MITSLAQQLLYSFMNFLFPFSPHFLAFCSLLSRKSRAKNSWAAPRRRFCNDFYQDRILYTSALWPEQWCEPRRLCCPSSSNTLLRLCIFHGGLCCSRSATIKTFHLRLRPDVCRFPTVSSFLSQISVLVRLLLFRFVVPLHRFTNDNLKKAGAFFARFWSRDFPIEFCAGWYLATRKLRNPTAVDRQLEPTISCWDIAGEKCERQAVYAHS